MGGQRGVLPGCGIARFTHCFDVIRLARPIWFWGQSGEHADGARRADAAPIITGTSGRGRFADADATGCPDTGAQVIATAEAVGTDGRDRISPRSFAGSCSAAILRPADTRLTWRNGTPARSAIAAVEATAARSSSPGPVGTSTRSAAATANSRMGRTRADSRAPGSRGRRRGARRAPGRASRAPGGGGAGRAARGRSISG
jgi:hypothetical protein